MDKQKPVNSLAHNDGYSTSLIESYTRWMSGDQFQNSTIKEAFDGMDPQSHGAEIEDTTKKKKVVKKEKSVAEETQCGRCGGSHPTDECPNVLEREEYEVDGEVYVLEKVKMDGKDDNGFKSCWKGYKKSGTKVKGDKEVNNCVKAGFEPEGDDLQEKAPPGEKYERMVKHIKKGYSKDGEVSDKEKSIAYATAWKAKNKKGMKESNCYDDHDEKMSKSSKKKNEKSEKKMEKEGYDVETAEALWSVVGEALKELGEMDGAKFKVIGEKMDPVGKEDGDIDNDGDKDKSDKYLHARRKKIGKILAMKKKS